MPINLQITRQTFGVCLSSDKLNMICKTLIKKNDYNIYYYMIAVMWYKYFRSMWSRTIYIYEFLYYAINIFG